MNFLLDENAEQELADFLETQGHNVKIVRRDYPSGLPDIEVLRLAHAERRILVTNDRDFGDLIFRQRLPHAGVIFFRLGQQAIEEKVAALARALSEYPDQGPFLVITKRRIRAR